MTGWTPGLAPPGQYDFNWRLSGDARVAPLQVFSGAGKTWMQFPSGRALPALFAETRDGIQPLPFVRQEPYVVIEGIWPALVFRGGHHMARAERTPSGPAPVIAPVSSSPPAS